MGINQSTQNLHFNHASAEVLDTYNDHSNNKNSFKSSRRGIMLRDKKLNQEFQVNAQSLQVLTRQQIVQNNYSEEFDPLFTTFRPQNKSIYGKFRILRSNITNQKIQEYKLSFRSQNDFKTYIISYFWRKNNGQDSEWPIVRTTNFSIYEQSRSQLEGGIAAFFKGQCTSSKQILCKSFVEDIPLRLCHIKDIPFPQNLYVLKQTLRGFNIIYQNIGYLKPFDDLICITRKGVVKVWINSDLSKNFPNLQNIDQNITTSKSQSKLINQILHLISVNTDSQDEPISFFTYLKENHISLEFICFDKIYQMIERYVSELQIQVPQNFSSIVEVLNQQEEEYDTYRTDMELQNQENPNISRQIPSRKNSGSGLFLDVHNNVSNRRKRQNNRDKTSSQIESSNSKNMKSKDSSSKRRNKTQSLKAGKNQNISMESSIAGVRSNVILSESLPISRNLNIPAGSSVEGGGNSGILSNMDNTSRIKSNSQLNKSNNNQNSQNLVDKKSPIQIEKQTSINKRHQQFVEYVKRQQSTMILQKQKIPVRRNTDNLIIQQQPQENSFKYQNSSKLLKNQINLIQSQNPHTKDPFTDQHNNLSTYRKTNKMNSQKLFNNQYSDEIQLHIIATQEQLKEMKQIDKYLEEQVLQEQYEREKQQQIELEVLMEEYAYEVEDSPFDNEENNFRTVSQKQQSRQKMPQQLGINKRNHKSQLQNYQSPLTGPFNGNESLDGTYCILPKNIHEINSNVLLNIQSPSPSREIQPSSSRIQNKTIRTNQKKYSYQPDQLNENQNFNKKQVLCPVPRIYKQNQLIEDFSSDKSPQKDQYFSIQQLPQVSKVQINVPLSSGQSNLYSNSTNQNNVIQHRQNFSSDNQNINSGYIDCIPSNNIPLSGNQVISTSTMNQMAVFPAYQSSIQRSTPPITSATSIGHAVNISNMVIPQAMNQPPKVRFMIRTPQERSLRTIDQRSPHLNEPFNTSPHQTSVKYVSGLDFHQQLTTSNQNSQQSNFKPTHNQYYPIRRLASKTNTIVSHYAHGSGSLGYGINSSRKYFQNQSSSSKPSIVEYSLLNPQPNQQPQELVFFHNHLNQQQSHNQYNYQNISNPQVINQNQDINFKKPSIQQPIQQQPVSFMIYNRNIIPNHQLMFMQQHNQYQNQQYQQQPHHSYPHPQSFILNQMQGIVSIPEQQPNEMLSNTRQVRNEENNRNILQSEKKSFLTQSKQDESLLGNLINENSPQQRQDSETQNNPTPTKHHRRQSSGLKVISSIIQQRSFILQNSNKVFQTQHKVFQSQDKVFQSQNYDNNEQSHHHQQHSGQQNQINPHHKINIRPSFYSKQSSDNYDYPNFSYDQPSKQTSENMNHNHNRPNSNSNSNNLNENIHHHQNKPKNNNNNNNSLYRFVESIQQNRPHSSYQDELQNYNQRDDFIIAQQQSRTRNGNKVYHNNNLMVSPIPKGNYNALSGIYNPTSASRQVAHVSGNQSSSRTPTQSQYASPRPVTKFPLHAITGRTMFINNNQTQLNSEFIDPQSQLQSQVDYTYNSYDKWKDTSKVIGYAQNRFNTIDNQKQDQINFGQPNFNRYNLGYNNQQRHSNHRQLVKSSIQGLNNGLMMMNHHFGNRFFNTDKKIEQERKRDMNNHILTIGRNNTDGMNMLLGMRKINQQNQQYEQSSHNHNHHKQDDSPQQLLSLHYIQRQRQRQILLIPRLCQENYLDEQILRDLQTM